MQGGPRGLLLCRFCRRAPALWSRWHISRLPPSTPLPSSYAAAPQTLPTGLLPSVAWHITRPAGILRAPVLWSRWHISRLPPGTPLPSPNRQAFLLISIGAAAAARAVHTYRSSLWTQGAVAVCLSIAQGSNAFRTIFMAGLPVRAVCECPAAPRVRPPTGHAFNLSRRSHRLHASIVCTAKPPVLPPCTALQSDAHDRWCAYVAGVSCYVAADFILAWAGDTL